MTTTEQQMCPFCPLLVEDELCQPIDNDFFGEPASIGGIRSCAECAQLVEMSDECDDDGEWLVEMLKDAQARKLSESPTHQ